MSEADVPNPYELDEDDAEELDFNDFDLETIELNEELNDEEELGDKSKRYPVMYDVVRSLLESDEPLEKIKKKLDLNQRGHFKNEMVKYFQYIRSQLQLPNVTYLDVYNEDPDLEWMRNYAFNYASFGTRFWDYLTKCGQFSRETLLEFSKLIYRFLQLHPQKLLHFRQELAKVCVQVGTNPPATTDPDRLKSIIDEALKPIDSSKLYTSLSDPLIKDERLDHFIQSVSQQSGRTKLTEVLRDTIESIFPELEPEFAQIGDDCNIDYRVLHYQLSFDVSRSNVLDESTRYMILTPVLRVMEKMGFNVVPSDGFRSVVINLDAADTEDDSNDGGSNDGGSGDDSDDDGEASECVTNRMLVISICSESFTFCKLVNFYLACDYRFGPMVLLFKYFLTESKILHYSRIANESFIWLIIWFLQKYKSILPTLKKLELSKNPFSNLIDFSDDLHLAPRSSTNEPLGKLVVQFIEWFCQFDFEENFLNPCDGSSHDKEDVGKYFCLDSDATCGMYEHLCIVNPFRNSLQTVYMLDVVAQWTIMFRKLKDEYEIDSEKYLLTLTDPEHFEIPDLDLDGTLAYMESDPMNPYKLSVDQAQDLEYPEDVSQMKVEPKSNPFNSIKPTSSQLVEFQFGQDFFFTSKSISDILESYNREHLQLHYKNIVNYFRHLQSRLVRTKLDHDQLFADKNDDYAAYGERFWQWLIECKLFHENYLRYYSIIIYRYLNKFPKNILNLRIQLRDVYLKIASSPNRKPQIADSEIVSYSTVFPKTLHKKICGIGEIKDQINHLTKEIYHTDKSKQFADFIIGMVNSDKQLAALNLSLEQTDVLHGGFNIFMYTIHFVIKFGSISEMLDRYTFWMALQVIKKSIAVRFKFEFSKIDTSSFSFQLSSTIPSSKTSFNYYVKLFPSSRDDYTGNALLMISQHDQRLRKMAHILLYWLRIHKLVFGNPFSCQQFVWLIVHFLQQTNPPVLPPLKQVMKSGAVKSIEPSANRKSTTTGLIAKFFKFCTKFDFINLVICPLDGTCCTKAEYCKKKKMSKFTGGSFSCIENPLSKNTFNLITNSPDQFVKFVTKFVDEQKMDSGNCIKLLTDPSIKVPT